MQLALALTNGVTRMLLLLGPLLLPDPRKALLLDARRALLRLWRRHGGYDGRLRGITVTITFADGQCEQMSLQNSATEGESSSSDDDHERKRGA